MRVPKKVNKILNVIFNAQVSENSMGGGDKIVISISNELQNAGFKLNFLGSPEGIGMAKANTKNTQLIILNNFMITKWGFIKTYLLRIVFSFTILNKHIETNSIVWSASDFLPDVIPAFWLKLFNKKFYWIGNMFLRARNPFTNEVSKNLTTILFYLSQNISLFMYKLWADQVCVLCQEDFDNMARYFGSKDRICLISGGIDTKSLDTIPKDDTNKYDACYIGRFHSQKGIPTLIKTWSEINKAVGPKQLGVIGWGNEFEESEIKRLIAESGCEDCIHLLGFKDGIEKIKVLKSSSIFLFPSNFESWGVVVAEALGCGVPVVAFDLKQIKNNFTEGVFWSKDYKEFFQNTLDLLTDTKKRSEMATKAYEFSKKLDWKYSAEKFIKNINL